MAKPEDEGGKKVETGKKRNPTRPQWEGRVSNVIDIEENLWSPRLGMKGKIDLTVETNQQGLLNSTTILPLEVKTGKPTYSTSHQGQVIISYTRWTMSIGHSETAAVQVIIYCMMSGDRRKQPTEGLLL